MPEPMWFAIALGCAGLAGYLLATVLLAPTLIRLKTELDQTSDENRRLWSIVEGYPQYGAPHDFDSGVEQTLRLVRDEP